MPNVTLGEGNTPLIESVRIGPMLGLRQLYFKLETTNPTGSYKDRFIAAEIRRLLALGAEACVATSSGNTGAALAAGCARFGLLCTIVVNQNAPAGKLIQMQAHGARLLRVQNFAADPGVTRKALEILESSGKPLVVSAYRYCPEGMAGVESLSAEIEKQLPEPPKHIFVPVGGGGLYAATVRGLQTKARVHAVQPAGCPTLVGAFDRGDDRILQVQSTTHISGLSVPFDIDASLALKLLRECSGLGIAVTDEEVWEAQRMLLQLEGIYCEPAGAAALAGLRRLSRRKVVQPHEPTVCLVTGHGFKDPDSITQIAERHPAASITVDQLAESLR
ncbi:MAG: PLP-dependent lyase/thiolase [Bryobacteraceae bacterium]